MIPHVERAGASRGHGTIDVVRLDESTLILMAGEFDAFDAINFRSVRNAVLEGPRPDVLVDASQVTFADYAFLGVLAALEADCLQRGGRFRIVDASPSVVDVCQTLQLERMLDDGTPPPPR